MSRKFLISVLLFCTLAVLTAVGISAAVVDSGFCGAEGDGSNLRWTLTDDGTLTISGTGAMADYTEIMQPDGVVVPTQPYMEYFGDITSIVVEPGVTHIGWYAFCTLYRAESVSLPEGLVTIGRNAFDRCFGLTEITLPGTVDDSIMSIVFQNCYYLKNVYVADGNVYLKSIDGVLFRKSDNALVYYPIGRTDPVYRIPDGTESIIGGAFYKSQNLEEVIIPDSVRGIYLNAFSDAKKLHSVYFEGNPPTAMVEDVFAGISGLTLYYYEAYADAWTSPTWTCPSGVVYNTVMIPALPGDFDGSGRVDADDVLIFSRYFAGWPGYADRIDFTAADFNNDGSVTRADCMYLARAAAGWDGYTLS